MIHRALRKKGGLTLIEMMVALAIFLFISVGIYAVFSTGQTTWFNTEASIELQQNLRMALAKVTRELQESGFDKNGVSQLTITDGTGVNGSDILRFSIPILCQSNMNVLDANGDVAYWGAPLTWGCTDSGCMDADNDCATTDYKYIQYFINGNSELVRRVLDNNNVMVREDILARYIVDFQGTANADGDLITLRMTTRKNSALNLVISASTTLDVNLRNRG